MKKNLYELLGASPSATAAELQAAFEQMMHQHGADSSDIQATILREAYLTLSDDGRRAAYDASLAARAQAPARIQVEIHEPRWSPQKILLMVIGTLVAIGLAIQIGFMLLSYRHANESLTEAAEAKVRLKEYEQTMGSPADIEAERVAAQERQFAREEQQQQRNQEQEQRQQERELEDARRYADRITNERVRAEERAAKQAEAEQLRQQREEQRRKQEEEYAVKRQLEADKRRLRELEWQNRR